jgi:DNA-binding response OmpR family regulator
MMEGRVLLVDDEPYILRILSFKLRREGFDTLEARSPEEALSILANNPVDLILLDVALASVTDGFDLAQTLRQDPATSDLPIIMLTARDLVGDVRRGHEVGAVGYITKPFSTAEVIHRIRAILGPAGHASS